MEARREAQRKGRRPGAWGQSAPSRALGRATQPAPRGEERTARRRVPEFRETRSWRPKPIGLVFRVNVKHKDCSWRYF